MTGKFQGKTIKKRGDIPLGLLCIIAIAVLVAPVAGLAIVDGSKITATDGATSPMIIIESGLAQDGAITIDVTELDSYVENGLFTTDNVVLDDAAVDAGWTVDIAGHIMTLTLTGRAIIDPEAVTVTFTGATNPWIANTEGEKTVYLTASMPDPSETATITFIIQTGGLSVTNGSAITTPNGITSPIIVITNTTIAENDGIIIDVSNINWFAVASGPITMDNIVIEDTADAATWTGEFLDENTLMLTSTEGPSVEGDTVTVTFTGDPNPWIVNTGGPQSYPLPVTRTDGLGVGTIDFAIETGVLGGLSVTNGDKITLPNGATSPVITITDTEIAQDGTITINVADIQEYIANGPLTTDNIVIDDSADVAVWTVVVDGNILTLTSTEGATLPDETVTVTFTGAINPWVADSHGNYIRTLTATRADTGQFATFDFAIQIVPVGDVTVTDGEKITSTAGTTSPVITITNAAIAAERTITINITDLHQYVASGNFTTANVMVSDTAAASEWTGIVTGDTLTLTSTGGATLPDDTVVVTFTGAINPWVDNSGGEKTVPLTVTRNDTFQTASINFMINTTPPPPVDLGPDFIASPRSGIAPLTVSFTDLSTGTPTEWTWDFGDGSATSAGQNPTHIYENTGSYNVTLWISNEYRNGLVSRQNYINVFNSAIGEADTEFSGLTITNCGGPQTITVNTSIITHYALSPGKSVLEIQAPPGSGFKNITFYTLNGIGFTQDGDLITGDPTGVHLVSEEISPSSGFSNEIGTSASFYYITDLPSYPCNAKLSTKIQEGVTPYYDTKFRQIASANEAFPVGTAYTATIIKTNFPSGIPAKIYMSVNSSWRPSLYGDDIFIWRIADDETYGQMLPTHYLYSDPVKNLDYYEADSPLGLSTIGISATTGNNNPFQIFIFVATNAINQGSNAQSGTGSGSGSRTGSSITTNGEPGGSNFDGVQSGPEQEPVPVVSNNPGPLTQPAISTNIGMLGWLLAIVQNNPIILIGVAGVIVVVGYFGWWKQRL
jgi:PKD repeat protein